MAVIVPPSADPVPEDLPANTIVGLQSQGRLPPRAQSLYDRTYQNSSGMADMMGGMRLDLPNIAAGLTQHETASNAPPQPPSMPPPPGVAQEPSPPQNQSPETDVNKIYTMLNELLEQLSANRQASIQLHSLAAGVKSQVVHSQTGYVLRRFNMDKTQEEYNAALEKMNGQMFSENNALLNDNKQLGTLIKEYEQTLENVMTAFRVRANEVQQRELAIVREYEQKILATESVQLEAVLSQQTDFSSSLGRTGELLRVLMRALGGEDPTSVPKSMLASIVESETGTASTGMGTGRDGEIDITSTAGHMAVGRHPQNRIINSLELEAPPSPLPATTALPDAASTSSITSTLSSPLSPSFFSYRLRLIHTGSAAQIRFSVDYHALSVIEVDGTLVEPYSVTGLTLDVAQRYSVLLTTNQTSGSFWMRAGLTSVVAVEGTTDDVRGIITYGTNTTTVPTVDTDPGVPDSGLSDMVVASLTPAVVDTPPDRTRFYTVEFAIDATSSGGTIAYMNTTSWTSLVGTSSLLEIINSNGTYATEGSSVDDTNQFFITEDSIETVDILLVNTGFGEHPFHLHGHRPWIMGFGTGTYNGEELTPTNPLRRDTFAVPNAGWLMLRYVSDNPGPWTLHCHIAWHMAAGLLMQVNSLPSVTAQFDVPQDVIDQCAA